MASLIVQRCSGSTAGLTVTLLDMVCWGDVFMERGPVATPIDARPAKFRGGDSRSG